MSCCFRETALSDTFNVMSHAFSLSVSLVWNTRKDVFYSCSLYFLRVVPSSCLSSQSLKEGDDNGSDMITMSLIISFKSLEKKRRKADSSTKNDYKKKEQNCDQL